MIRLKTFPKFGDTKTPWGDIEDYIENTWENIEILGLASDGVSKIYGLELGNHGKPCIYLQFGVHGDEWESVHHGLEVMRYLSRKKEPPAEWKKNIEKIVSRYCIYIIPCLNPWGYQNSNQNNINGVNINRNYPTDSWEKNENSGDNPGDQIETQYAVEKMNFYNPFLMIDGHTHGSGYIHNLIYYQGGLELKTFYDDLRNSLNFNFGGNLKPEDYKYTNSVSNPHSKATGTVYAIKKTKNIFNRPKVIYTLEPGKSKPTDTIFQMGINIVMFTLYYADVYYQKNKLVL